MGHQEDIVKTESKIIVVRNIQVILDRDVAELYGVTTKVVNQAIRNNPDKNTEDKVQAAMNEIFADNLPLKMRKLTFGVNLGILKFSLETT